MLTIIYPQAKFTGRLSLGVRYERRSVNTLGYLSVEHYPFSHELEGAILYNRSKYLEQNETDKLVRFNWVQNGEVIISCNLYKDKSRLVNARFSSFGGIEYTQKGHALLGAFIDALITWCSDNGFAEILLKLPAKYLGEDHLLRNYLEKAGFRTSIVDVNQHIQIQGKPYTQIIKRNEKKKLRRCEERGFEFKSLKPHSLPDAYALIADTRIRKGFPISMTLKAINRMFYSLQDSYFLFGVFDTERLIAVAVSIRINETVLYNFYHGDDASYRSYSPIVMLLDGIYSYCQNRGFQYLDLGTSSVQGKVNQGLYEFKKNCGCIDTEKALYSGVLIK